MEGKPGGRRRVGSEEGDKGCCKSPRERGGGPELRYGDGERKTEFKEVHEAEWAVGDKLEVAMKERADCREPFWLGEPSGWALAFLRLGILEEKHVLGGMETEFWMCWGWSGYQASRGMYTLSPSSLECSRDC